VFMNITRRLTERYNILGIHCHPERRPRLTLWRRA
jgi:hypothetical protein